MNWATRRIMDVPWAGKVGGRRRLPGRLTDSFLFKTARPVFLFFLPSDVWSKAEMYKAL